MLKLTICAAILVSGSAVSARAQSEQSKHEQWGESGSWIIKIDPSVGNGCYMEHTTETGTLIQVGFLPDRNGGFFAAYNADWTDFKEGAEGSVEFDFGKALFGGKYVDAVHEGLPGGYVFFNNPEFIKEFGRQNEVLISGDKGRALDFKLTGTAKAINAMRNCDAEQPR